MKTFTEGHLVTLRDWVLDAVLDSNFYVSGPFGQQYTVFDLLHNLTVNSLRVLHKSLSKKVEDLKGGDSWGDTNLDAICTITKKKDLVNLIIGYKLWKEEQELNNQKIEQIEQQIADIKESQKTPEQLLSELEAKLKELKN